MSSPEAAVQPVARHKQLVMHSVEDAEESVDLLEYWRSIAKRKKEIIGLGLVVALLAAAIVFAMTPIYRSTATLLIEANRGKVVNIEDVYSGISQSREYFQTQVEILKSREVAILAIKKAKLWNAPEFDPRKKQGGVLPSIQSALGMAPPEKTQWSEDELAEAVLGRFSKVLTVEPVRLSQLIRVSFDAADKDLAARMANTVAETYIENDMENRYTVTRNASKWLEERLSGLRQKLDASQAALQAYRDRHGIVDIKSMAQSGVDKQVEDITLKMIEARVKRMESESSYNQIKHMGSNSDLSVIPAVARNPAVADAIKTKADTERNLQELAQRYGQQHPKYIQAEAQVKAAKDNLRRQEQVAASSVTREYESALATERAMASALAQTRGSIQAMNRNEAELTSLERDVQSNQQLYEMFMKRAKETSVSEDLQTPVARVVDSAVVAGGAFKPKKTQIVAIALVLGLFAGVVIALLLDRLDNTLKTTEDVEMKLKEPLLTSLPLVPAADRSSLARLFMDKPQSLYAEAIRTARTGVLLSAIDLPNRVLLVTSSVPGEGKSTFSINLALAHAHTKK